MNTYPTQGKYILDENKEVKEVFDLYEWGKWMQTEGRHVGFNEIGDITVSTVFMGLDFNLGGSNPHFFETMVFQKDATIPLSTRKALDDFTRRYATYDEALEGHSAVLNEVNKKYGKTTE